MLSHPSSVLWPPPTSQPASSRISLFRLIPFVTVVVGYRPGETSPVPSPAFTTSRSLYTGGFLAAAFSGSSPLPWPSLRVTSSTPSCSPLGVNMSVLQDSLNVTGCCFAPLSQGVSTLQYSQSPDCTGCLLRGLLIVATTGLPPVSRR